MKLLRAQSAAKAWSGFDASRIRWGHAVNSQSALRKFLRSGSGIAEGDVVMSANGPIMAHPPVRTSDLTLKQWVRALMRAGRRMKIDIKDAAVVRPVAEVLQRLGVDGKLVVLNADIMRGPGGGAASITLDDLMFLRRSFPRSLISLGATTGGLRPGTYTSGQLSRLEAAADKLGGPITFALRADLVTPAMLQRLDNSDAKRNVTLWNSSEVPGSANLYHTLERISPNNYLDLFSTDKEPIGASTRWARASDPRVTSQTKTIGELTAMVEGLKIDPERLLQRGIVPALATDLDGTLWRSHGLGPAVVAVARERGMLTAQPREKLDNLLRELGVVPNHSDEESDRGVSRDFSRAWIAFIAWRGSHDQSAVAEMTQKMEEMYAWILAGISQDSIERLVDGLIDSEDLPGRVFQGIPHLLQAAREQGMPIMVVTTSPDVVAKRFNQRIFGIPPEHTLGMQVKIDEAGILTTEITGPVPFRVGKREALATLLAAHVKKEYSGHGTGASRAPNRVLIALGDNPQGNDAELLESGLLSVATEPSSAEGVRYVLDKIRDGSNYVFLDYKSTQDGGPASDFMTTRREFPVASASPGNGVVSQIRPLRAG